MRLRVLGPTELLGPDGPVTVPAKPRTLLAALAIRLGAVASADELLDALWPDELPASAAKLLQVYVSQLRKALPPGVRIATRTGGYALEIAPADVDAVRFAELVADGRRALANGNPALAASMLRRGLDLWRGPAYADVRYEEFAREEVQRLEGLRAAAIAERIDADLQLGRHAEVAGEARALLVAEPTNERLAAQAMLAAYRAAGAADAMVVFETVASALRDELGAEPGDELLELADRVAARDPALAAPATHAEPAPSLPAAPNALIGREVELRDLHALVERPGVRLVSLTGAGGSGKSRLGLELARALAPRFANGAVLVELASLRDRALVLPTIARALGLDPGPDAFPVVAAALAPRQQLLLVDNMEHLRAAAPDLVRLLAAAPHLVIVVTTRVVLHVSGEYVFPVGPLDEPSAVALFAERAQALDRSFVLDEPAHARVAGIVRRLDGLPLPIELAAARVRSLGLRTLDERLASRLSTLTGGPRDLPARQQTLRETLAWSVHLLAPAEASALGALAVFPSGCSRGAASRVAGADDEILAALVDHNLVQVGEVDGERRYRLLETVREYAYELLGDGRRRVEDELVAWMRDELRGVDLMLDAATVAPAYRFLDLELDTLRDVLAHAGRDDDGTDELALAAAVWRYWWVRGHLAEARTILDGIVARRGLVATRDGIRTVRAQASIAWSMGESAAARRIATEALEVADRIGDRIEQTTLHNLLGVLANGAEDVGEATTHFERAVEIALDAGREDLATTARTNVAGTYLRAGRIDDARDTLLAVLAFRTARNEVEAIGYVHLNLGEIEVGADRLDDAEAHYRAAIAAFRAIGFQTRMANSIQGLAAVESLTGRPESAARRLGQAAALLGEAGWGADGTALVPDALARTRDALGDERFETLFREGATIPAGD